MIWIPVFAAVTLLAIHLYAFRAVEHVRNFVSAGGGGDHDLHRLNEQCVLGIGPGITPVKISLALCYGFMLVPSLITGYYYGWTPLGVFSFEGAKYGFGLGVVLGTLPILGINLHQPGHILIDQETLRVPRLFGVRVFARGETRVWVYRSVGNVCSCLVRDGHKRARFIIDDESIEILKLWAMYDQKPQKETVEAVGGAR